MHFTKKLVTIPNKIGIPKDIFICLIDSTFSFKADQQLKVKKLTYNEKPPVMQWKVQQDSRAARSQITASKDLLRHNRCRKKEKENHLSSEDLERLQVCRDL